MTIRIVWGRSTDEERIFITTDLKAPVEDFLPSEFKCDGDTQFSANPQEFRGFPFESEFLRL